MNDPRPCNDPTCHVCHPGNPSRPVVIAEEEPMRWRIGTSGIPIPVFCEDAK